jgi:hypothetical protein
MLQIFFLVGYLIFFFWCYWDLNSRLCADWKVLYESLHQPLALVILSLFSWASLDHNPPILASCHSWDDRHAGTTMLSC